MGWKKNNPGDPCCVNCVILEDTFDRADSTNLGSDWDERAGDWSISSNAAVCDSATGLMATTSTHPDAVPDGVVEIVVNVGTANDVARAVIGYVDDSNFFFAQARFTATDGFLRLGKVVAGVTTMLGFSEITNASAQTGTDAVLRVCYANGVLTAALYATTTSPIPVYTSATQTITGTKVGIGTGTRTGTISFKSFSWQHQQAVGYETCPNCQEPCVYCDTGTWPFAFQVEFDGVVDGDCASCESFNDTVFLLLPYYDATSSPGVSGCIYALDVSDCAGITDIALHLPGFRFPTVTRNDWWVNVNGDGEFQSAVSQAEPWDCSVTPSVTWLGGANFYCDWSAATCSILPLI